MSAFYLVQRLSPAWRRDPERGFDGYFECEYMGSAEFEFGAIPQSLKRIRAAKNHGIYSFRCDALECDVWLVGPSDLLTDAATKLNRWASGAGRTRPFYGKEHPHLAEVAAGDTKWVTARAWWSLDDDVMFALNSETAYDLLAAIKAVKK